MRKGVTEWIVINSPATLRLFSSHSFKNNNLAVPRAKILSILIWMVACTRRCGDAYAWRCRGSEDPTKNRRRVMKPTAAAVCFIFVIALLQALVGQPRTGTSQDLLGGPDGVFVPADAGVWPTASASVVSRDSSTCTNCLIRRCVVSGGFLTGYCLEGARGGICHTAYDPSHCPAGKPPLRKVSRQCGPSVVTVDNLRPCQ